MTQKLTTKTQPFSVRLTPEERSRLERQAGNQPLGEYIRTHLLEQDSGRKTSKRGQFLIKDHQALAKVLALLGKSHYGSSMAKLADAARIGSLPITEETEAQLRRACGNINAIKSLIMKALAIQED